MTVFQRKFLIKINQGKESIANPILTQCRKEFLCRERFCGAHNPLKGAICDLSFVFSHPIVDLIVCEFEVFRKFA